MTQEQKRLQAIQVADNKEDIAFNRKLLIGINAGIIILITLVAFSFDRQLHSSLEDCERNLFEKLYNMKHPKNFK